METKEQKINRYERVIEQIKVDLMKLEDDKKFLKKRLKQLERELEELYGNKRQNTCSDVADYQIAYRRVKWK